MTRVSLGLGKRVSPLRRGLQIGMAQHRFGTTLVPHRVVWFAELQPTPNWIIDVTSRLFTHTVVTQDNYKIDDGMSG
jgi:hypothetical protein